MNCDDDEHDLRINPFETIRSWPVSITAVCANPDCDYTRQLGPRGWTIKRDPVEKWPAIRLDQPKEAPPDQLTLT